MRARVGDARLRELTAAMPDRMGGTLVDTLLLRELAAEILAARVNGDLAATERAARGQAWALAEAQGEAAMLRARLAAAEARAVDAEAEAARRTDDAVAIGAALGREGATAGECVRLIEGLRAQVAAFDREQAALDAVAV